MPVINQENDQSIVGRVYHKIGGENFGIGVTAAEMQEFKNIGNNPDMVDLNFKALLKQKNPEAYAKAMSLESKNLNEQIKSAEVGVNKDFDKSIDRAIAMAASNFEEGMKNLQGQDTSQALHR